MKNLAINLQPLIYGTFPVCRNYTVRAHFRNDGNLQRRGCENPVQCAGPLQRRVHTGHLYAHHQRYAARRSGENRRLHGIGHRCQHPGASRPAGAGPVQGDTVRESGIKETRPKGQITVPWASGFRLKEKPPHFLCRRSESSSTDIVYCDLNAYSLGK